MRSSRIFERLSHRQWHAGRNTVFGREQNKTEIALCFLAILNVRFGLINCNKQENVRISKRQGQSQKNIDKIINFFLSKFRTHQNIFHCNQQLWLHCVSSFINKNIVKMIFRKTSWWDPATQSSLQKFRQIVMPVFTRSFVFLRTLQSYRCDGKMPHATL